MHYPPSFLSPVHTAFPSYLLPLWDLFSVSLVLFLSTFPHSFIFSGFCFSSFRPLTAPSQGSALKGTVALNFRNRKKGKHFLEEAAKQPI